MKRRMRSGCATIANLPYMNGEWWWRRFLRFTQCPLFTTSIVSWKSSSMVVSCVRWRWRRRTVNALLCEATIATATQHTIPFCVWVRITEINNKRVRASTSAPYAIRVPFQFFECKYTVWEEVRRYANECLDGLRFSFFFFCVCVHCSVYLTISLWCRFACVWHMVHCVYRLLTVLRTYDSDGKGKQ